MQEIFRNRFAGRGKRIVVSVAGLAVLGVLSQAPVIAAALTISPASVTLTNYETVKFTVDESSVTWSLSPSVGQLIPYSGGAIYTVPANLTQSESVQVTVTDTSKKIATAVLMLVPTITVAVTPASADLVPGGQQTMIATVTGSTNTGVNWSLSPQIGSISSDGVYTAPASLTQDTTVNVTAIAQANTSVTATAPVRLHANGIYFTTYGNGLKSVVWNGTNYNYLYGEGLLTNLYLEKPSGTVTQYTPSCTNSFTVTTVTGNCVAGGDSFTISVAYSTPSLASVQADITLTNNSATDTVSSAMFSTLGVAMTQFAPNNSLLGNFGPTSTPVDYGNFVTGRFAIWTNTPGPNVGMNQACGWSYVCKNQPEIFNLGPGQTATISFTLRFTTNMTETTYQLAPEAYAAYQAAYPYTVNWPDRRPIMAWFTADHGHQSATNPRGYLFNPALNASNIPGFQTSVMSQAQSILSSMQSRPVQPQGIVLWDIEGQEFIQPTTYIGDPRVFAEGYAPEMNATADQVFALFKNAGYKVGITLRPDYLQWGPAANLPSTCNYNSDNSYKDYYIEVDAAYQKTFYACYAPNTWSLIPAGNGAQTMYQSTQVQQVTNLLLSKVAYARARWGTTIYYVDSTVWDGGAPMTAAIFRALQSAYPDSLFLPEESYIGTLGVSIPYAAPNGSLNAEFAPASWRYAYPAGAIAENLSNCAGSCWTSGVPNFEIGQQIGDIAMYSVPAQLSASQLTAIETMILQARAKAGTVTVTDSSTGSVYTYTGSPATVYQYPLKMRVYFADSAAGLASSSTYCENGSWLGTNSCTLNLAGLTSAQIRYYDFGDNLVITGPAQGR